MYILFEIPLNSHQVIKYTTLNAIEKYNKLTLFPSYFYRRKA